MNRKLKALGILIGAVFTIGGLLVDGANAHTPARFTSEQNVTTIRGSVSEGNFNMTVTGSKVACENAELHGTAVGKSVESLTLTPTFEECAAFGFLGAKVTGFGQYGEVEKCDLVINAANTAEVVCPAGREVTVEVGSTCVVHIPAQAAVGEWKPTTTTRTVTITNPHQSTTKHALILDFELEGLTVTHTDSFLCPFEGSGEVSTATLEVTESLWGEDPTTKALVGITWDATEV